MGRIAQTFERLKVEQRKGLIPFITAGHPDLETTRKLLLALQTAGADVIELGVPFSDPIADGPVIQQSSQHALSSGVTLQKILTVVAELRSELTTPLVLFSYLNPVLQFGIDKFSREAADAGVDGVLFCDLPLDEAADIKETLVERSVDLILLAAPTSTDDRLHQIAATASGFIYAVSRTGVTGTRDALSNEAEQLVRRLRPLTSLPIAVGFGISTADQIAQVWDYADGAVVGSALVKEINDHADHNTLVEHVEEVVRSLFPSPVVKE